MYKVLILGLDDYTTDERGDVGSRVRIASIQGLTSVSLTLLTLVKSDPAYSEYLPADLYQEAISGILKQGVERLDNVRQHAGESVIRLLRCPPPSVDGSNPWKFRGEHLFEELLLRYDSYPALFLPFSNVSKRDNPDDDPAGSHGWQDGTWIFPRAMKFLEIPEYRHSVLAGLLVSVGSKTDSTVNGFYIRRRRGAESIPIDDVAFLGQQRHVRSSIVAYTKRLPAEANNGGGNYSLHAFATDLIGEAKSNLNKNSKVIPVLQVFNLLLETDALERLFETKGGINRCEAMHLSCISELEARTV